MLTRTLRALFCAGWLATGAACSGKVIAAFPDNFVGVGVELTMRDGAPSVVRTLDGGPAASAGLEPNDRVVAIDHVPTQGMALADVVVRLRGEEGSKVDVTLKRGEVEVVTTIKRTAMERSTSGYSARSTQAP